MKPYDLPTMTTYKDPNSKILLEGKTRI